MTETTIQFACSGCGKRYSCPKTYAGRKTKCGKCGESILVPQTSGRVVEAVGEAESLIESVSFSCGLCGTRMSVPLRYIGRKVKCPDCTHATIVPEPEVKRAKPRPAAMSGEQYEVYEGEEQPRGIDLARASPKSISFTCRVCQTHLQALESEVGKPVACPDCGVETPVPKLVQPIAKRVLVEDHYEVDEEDDTATAPNLSLYDNYVSKPPLGYKTLASKGDDPRGRRDDGIERTINAPRWGLGLLSGFVTCFSSSSMLMALLGLTLATMLTLPMIGITGSLVAAGDLNGFLVGFIMTVFSLGLTLLYLAIGSAIYWGVLSDSAAGSKRVENWPAIDPGQWMGPTLCVVFSSVVAAIPGSLLAGAVSRTAPQFTPIVGFVGTWLILPWLQLAQLDNDSAWGVLSSRLARTLYHAPATWIAFYALTLGIAISSIEIVELAVTHLGLWAVLIISPVFAIETVLYAWLVGRVGWAAGAATPEKDEAVN